MFHQIWFAGMLFMGAAGAVLAVRWWWQRHSRR